MRYGGRRWWYGQQVHVMYCPLCSHERLYVYDRFGRIRRAA
jgi:hypothetical protein